MSTKSIPPLRRRAHLAVLRTMIELANDAGEVWATYAGLGEHAGYSARTAYLAICEIETRGLVKHVRTGREGNAYKVDLDSARALANYSANRRYSPAARSPIMYEVSRESVFTNFF